VPAADSSTPLCARIPITNIFLGGIIPGILMMVGTSWWGMRQNPRSSIERQPFVWAKARQALWEAKWELLLPVVTFASLFSGFATPVEAAAVTAMYAFSGGSCL
jgi:TRAP-type C4-dicarboxylate transport system permease large subunit